jgi:hypothetical protein
MVIHDRPVYQEEHAAQLIMARRFDSPLKGRIHLRRSVDRPFAFPLQSGGGPYIFGELSLEKQIRLIGNEVRSARVRVSKAIVLGHARFELISNLRSIWEDEAALEFQRVRFVFSKDSEKQELLARS